MMHDLSWLKTRRLERQGGPTRGSRVFNTIIQMEAGHLRENPQTPQQQETPQAITWGLQKADGLSFSGRQSSHQKLQVGSSSNRYAPRLPQQETKSSTKQLAPTGLWKTFSNPASLKRASPFRSTYATKFHWNQNICASATLMQKTSKNEPKHGPKSRTAWRSHFWDRMHSLVKEQKKSTLTVPKMRPQNRKIHSKGRPLPQTQNYNWVYLSNQQIDLEQRRPPLRSLISIDFPAPEMEPESAHVVSAVSVP